ncbi:uroporphyrinogen-III synthase [Novosphingobium sp. B1]|uniref:uroporphyrinogen-III synthase n=1 Tax=Novosphingobium sp. B1 TaxID=1938756 RepID=UPI0009D79B7B|nr:uroporphyrinogen-III synthase [Novosphingobium sp. B1]SMC97454.1 uroporphyrinogen-III synthase [Novosphingobium sp. B1]
MSASELLPLVVIRPEPGNAATCAAAREMGLQPVGAPLFEIEPVEWDVPAMHFDAILAGSANVFRHGGPGLARFADVPVIAVGETTAAEARAAGFAIARIGGGGLQPIVATLAPGNYIRIAGEDRVILDPPEGVRIETAVVYAALKRAFPAQLQGVLAQPAVVLLHSGEAARHFARECERLGIRKENLHLACLAPRIAELAGSGWGSVAVAAGRTDNEVLELAHRMCQTV